MDETKCEFSHLVIGNTYTLNVTDMPCVTCEGYYSFEAVAYYRGHGVNNINNNYGDFFEFLEPVVCPHCSQPIEGILKNCNTHRVDLSELITHEQISNVLKI